MSHVEATSRSASFLHDVKHAEQAMDLSGDQMRAWGDLQAQERDADVDRFFVETHAAGTKFMSAGRALISSIGAFFGGHLQNAEAAALTARAAGKDFRADFITEPLENAGAQIHDASRKSAENWTRTHNEINEVMGDEGDALQTATTAPAENAIREHEAVRAEAGILRAEAARVDANAAKALEQSATLWDQAWADYGDMLSHMWGATDAGFETVGNEIQRDAAYVGSLAPEAGADITGGFGAVSAYVLEGIAETGARMNAFFARWFGQEDQPTVEINRPEAQPPIEAPTPDPTV